MSTQLAYLLAYLQQLANLGTRLSDGRYYSGDGMPSLHHIQVPVHSKICAETQAQESTSTPLAPRVMPWQSACLPDQR